MLSIKEVARLTGLSTATVSRALDPRYAEQVRPATRKKILAVCDSADYRPGMAGRSFVTGKSYKVGFISGAPASDCGNQLFGHFIQGAAFELQKSNYSLLLLGAPPDGEQQIIDFLRSNAADAYILGNALVTDKVAKAISRNKAPVLMLQKQSAFPNALTLHRNICSAFREIWERIPREYYGKVIFFGHEFLRDRYECICQCAPEGVELPSCFIPGIKEFMETRYRARQGALKNLDRLKQFKIFWCSSDLLALGLKDALEENTSLAAGKDFYLIGFDNIENCGNFCTPPFLSTVDCRMEETGRLAARMILDTLAGKETPANVEFDAVFLPRASFPDLNKNTKELP